MHVAFVVPETVHHRETDASVRLDRIARMLVDRGHEVTVLCTSWWEADDVDEFEGNDVVYRALTGDRDARRSFTLRLPMALRRLDPDVIHADARAPGAVVACRAGRRLTGAPLVVEWYGTDPRAGRAGRSVDGADRHVVPSRLVRRWVREAGADEGDCVVVPNPIDVERVLDARPDPDVGADLVYARRLDEGANLEVLLLALAELRGYDWSATVIGDGPRREEYEDQADDLQIEDRIDFVGHRPLDGRIAAYRASHAFVQTARRCAFAEDLLWALTAGCIGIVEYHAESSAHELVEGRDRSFRTTDEEELVDAIVEASEMEARNFDERFAEFDRTEVVEGYVDLYTDLLAERGRL
ncbi:glycosyl transferase family 1 [Halobacteriales archaeon QS_8_69_26]|nr:MAG: glycosyl transferase family 1 [Halobacteriales archaeon QS_8_69_26]